MRTLVIDPTSPPLPDPSAESLTDRLARLQALVERAGAIQLGAEAGQPIPEATVAELTATVVAQFGRAMPLAVAEALTRLLDSHRAADARELANACEQAGAIGLAAAIDVALLQEVDGRRP